MANLKTYQVIAQDGKFNPTSTHLFSVQETEVREDHLTNVSKILVINLTKEQATKSAALFTTEVLKVHGWHYSSIYGAFYKIEGKKLLNVAAMDGGFMDINDEGAPNACEVDISSLGEMNIRSIFKAEMFSLFGTAINKILPKGPGIPLAEQTAAAQYFTLGNLAMLTLSDMGERLARVYDRAAGDIEMETGESIAPEFKSWLKEVKKAKPGDYLATDWAANKANYKF